MDFPKSVGTINTTSLPFRNGGIVENSFYLLNIIGIQILAQIPVRKGTCYTYEVWHKGFFQFDCYSKIFDAFVKGLFLLNQGQLKQPSPILPATQSLLICQTNQHSFPI